jgi:hypothetical protein
MTKQYQWILSSVFSCLLGLFVGYKLALFYSPSRGVPVVSSDRIIAGGQKYKDMLGKAYGAAWDKAAAALDRNVPLHEVMVQIGADWQKGREEAYGATITPVLVGVVPEGTPDRDVTATQRARLADGFRRFAIGLSQ